MEIISEITTNSTLCFRNHFEFRPLALKLKITSERKYTHNMLLKKYVKLKFNFKYKKVSLV